MSSDMKRAAPSRANFSLRHAVHAARGAAPTDLEVVERRPPTGSAPGGRVSRAGRRRRASAPPTRRAPRGTRPRCRGRCPPGTPPGTPRRAPLCRPPRQHFRSRLCSSGQMIAAPRLRRATSLRSRRTEYSPARGRSRARGTTAIKRLSLRSRRQTCAATRLSPAPQARLIFPLVPQAQALAFACGYILSACSAGWLRDLVAHTFVRVRSLPRIAHSRSAFLSTLHTGLFSSRGSISFSPRPIASQ